MKLFRNVFAGLFLVTLLMAMSGKALAQGSVIISADENGNGSLAFSDLVGLTLTIPSGMLPDPGPGGLTSALTYDMGGPPSLEAGDVIIQGPGGVTSHIIRFNPDETAPGSLASFVFYSKPGTKMAETGFPTALYPNTVTIPEGAKGSTTYTPTVGQPGYVDQYDVTYIFIPRSLVISEFRTQGTTANDEFIELYNPNVSSVYLGDYTVEIEGGSTLTIPPGYFIPARGHFLLANSDGYCLSCYAEPDFTYDGTDEPANAGIRLLDPDGTVTDAVGFTSSSSGFKERTGLAPVVSLGQYSHLRNLSTGTPKDTDDNAADFKLVSTEPAVTGGVLGAPGPENAFSEIERNGEMLLPGLIEPIASATQSPNRVRDTNPYDDSLSGTGNYPLGTMAIRRAYTNNTGLPITSLRFRIVDITAGTPPAPGTADLRAVTSPGVPSITTSTGTFSVIGTTLEMVPFQQVGGGINSTLSVDTIDLDTPLNPGEKVNVEWLLGIKQGGNFRFFVNIEGLQEICGCGGPPELTALKQGQKSGKVTRSAWDRGR